MFTGKTIFYGALDWGLGHATRSVPIIRELVKNNTVILGVTPMTRLIFDEEFPHLAKLGLPAYNMRYSKTLPLWIKLLLDYPKINRTIRREHKLLGDIIAENKIDVVISDNRFGLYSDKVHSVFITHQLFLKTPVFQSLANRINQNYISRYHEIWVPDFENESESLSGELSHGKHLRNELRQNVKYIGPQSRMKQVNTNIENKPYDVLVLLSGPEPSRTELENKLLQIISTSQKKVALVRGSKFKIQNSAFENSDVYDLPSKEELKKLILSSKQIICRSGYSTLMDMHVLEKKDLVLIPTPGQTEQEYLADHWKKKFGTHVIKQNEINKLINFVL